MIPTTLVGWVLLVCFAFVLGFGIAAGQKVFTRLLG